MRNPEKKLSRHLQNVALMVIGCAAVWPGSAHAQEAQEPSRSLRSDWTFTAGAIADSNPFRLSDAEQADLQSGANGYFDMNAVEDVGMLVGIEGIFRTRRDGGRRLRFGFAAESNLYARNMSRTRVALGSFFAYSLSRRDEFKVALDFDPSSFRGNYVVGYDNVGAEIFAAGDATRTSLTTAYQREVYDEGDRSITLAAEVGRGWTTFTNLPWRDRVDTNFHGSVSADLSKAVDVDVEVGWSDASHDGVPEPYNGQMVSLNRDFTSLALGTAFGLDLSRRAKLVLEYSHRTRSFDATQGSDPRYGGRSDMRRTVGANLRLEPSRSVDVWLGGRYRLADTRKAGSTTSSPDYRRAGVSLIVEYAR